MKKAIKNTPWIMMCITLLFMLVEAVVSLITYRPISDEVMIDVAFIQAVCLSVIILGGDDDRS